MRKIINPLTGCLTLITVAALAPTSAMAAGVLGEYSFLHVTFGSVWHLFLFIFTLVMIPFVLIIVMSWRFRKIKEEEIADTVSGNSPSDGKKE